MIEDGVLQLLPGRGLDQSILVAVLVGMALLLLFTEAYGWVYVGLVVPGYLASVFVIQPAAGTAVVFESLATFLLSAWISELLSRVGSWSPFFGRERFFLIVLVSVVVRQASQVWVLPTTLSYLDHQFGTTFRTDQEFFSIGLVLVPLTANMFWKLGIRNGLPQIVFPVGVTYLLLQTVLLPLTNLSLSNLELTYENVALDFLGSPKAYMILLTTAILAARYNLLFGWDYNGILVPSLLALTWFSPSRVAFTLAESLVLYFATRAILAIPALRTVNLEGPRKVFLVFLTGFFIKCALGWVCVLWFPEIKITDYFGFGYVLTSLLATKMLTKRIIGRVLFPTVLVSAIGFVVGSGIGFGLEQISPKVVGRDRPVDPNYVPTLALTSEPLGGMVLARVRARPVVTPDLRQGRSGTELGRYAFLWRAIDRWVARETPPDEIAEARQEVEKRAADMGLALLPMPVHADQRPRFLLTDREERLQYQTGWDTAILSPGGAGPHIEVPRPRSEAPSAEYAATLCLALDCRVLIAAGVDPEINDTSVGNALTHPRSTFQVAHEQLRSAAILQMRADPSATPGIATLHLRHTVPPELQLGVLWPGRLELSWQRPPGPLQQWAEERNFSVLRLHPEDLWWALSSREGREVQELESETLAAWLSQRADQATQREALDAWPSQSEVFFLESLLAADLLQRRTERFPWIARMAEMIGYRLLWLPRCAGHTRCWVLGDPTSQKRWGTLIVSEEPETPLSMEVPRPSAEPGTTQLAIEMWSMLRGDALTLATPEPRWVNQGEDDTSLLGGMHATPLQGLHQAMHRRLSTQEGALIVQVRGMAAWRPIPHDLVVAMGVPVLQTRQIPASLIQFLTHSGPLGWLGNSTKLADGAAQFVPLTGNGTPQMVFSRAAGDVDLALMWFSHAMRERFARGSLARHAQPLELALGKPVSVSMELASERLLEPALAPTEAPVDPHLRAVLDDIVVQARRYSVTHNGYLLGQLVRNVARRSDAQMDVVWNETMSLPVAHITVQGRDGHVLRALTLLAGEAEEREDNCPTVSAGDPDHARRIQQLVLRRCRRVVLHGLIPPEAP